MRKSLKRLKVIAIILSVVAVLTITFLPGCTTERVTIPQNLDELSVVKIWDTVAKVTNVQNDSGELESFRLLIDENGKIDSLTYIFHEDLKAYRVDIDSKGELDWNSYQNKLPATRHPIEVLSEIDKVRFTSLKTGEAGLLLQADFSFNNVGYSNDYLNIYQLENGNLIPLKEIIFNGTPYCVISVYQRTSNGLGTTATTAARGERTSTEIWFLTQDVNRAKIVESF